MYFLYVVKNIKLNGSFMLFVSGGIYSVGLVFWLSRSWVIGISKEKGVFRNVEIGIEAQGILNP